MTRITHEQVEAVIGPVDNLKVTAIIATGARLEDIVEAQALVAGQSDIAGGGERQISGLAMEVYVILTS